LLLAAEPHSGSTFDVIGSLGVAITVLLCATVAMAILALPGENAAPPDANSPALLFALVAGAVVLVR
jgi:hypothetical protein